MLIEGFPAEMAGTNCFVMATGPGEQCIIVDPGYHVAGRLDEIIAKHRLHPAAVVLTHGHLDHVFSVFPVCQANDVPAYIHSADRSAIGDPWTAVGLPVGSPIFGLENLTFAEPDDVRELSDADHLEIAGLTLTVRHAPGHTQGSVVFDAPIDDQQRVLFAGDVLFAGSIGRTDLPGGSMAAMNESLKNVILPMADDIIVLPGHGPQTTIGQERLTNPFLRDLM
jgi:hydroxyacylglutathione hydrolase